MILEYTSNEGEFNSRFASCFPEFTRQVCENLRDVCENLRYVCENSERRFANETDIADSDLLIPTEHMVILSDHEAREIEIWDGS